MKIAFFDTKPYDKHYFEKYGKLYDISFKFFETKLNQDTVDLAKGYDGVCVFVNDTINSHVIERLYQYNVSVIALRCAGFNNVDIKAAAGKLHILRVPAYSPAAVAEHTMALLLTSIRRIHKAYIRSKEFNFSLVGLTGMELKGKTIGIIGTGRIGQAFINICKGFGMKILAYDKYPNIQLSKEIGFNYMKLEQLFSESDIISLHCPLTEETHYIINQESLNTCKNGVIIINTSRGALVDTEALLQGIKGKKVGAACLDVYEEESDLFFEDNSGHIIHDDTLARLITMPNVIVTSHQAFLTNEALESIAKTTIENIVELLATNHCKNELFFQFK